MILGFSPADLALFIAISLAICITVCTLAMEASVLFVPAFVFLFPHLTGGFPELTPNEAIGLAITVEFFGYTSSVTGYWLRRQVDFRIAGNLLAFTLPLAIAGRLASYFVPSQGLLIVFGLLLLGLAAILYRAYRSGPKHTCLLCGDSITKIRQEKAAALAQAARGSPAYRPRRRLFGRGERGPETRFPLNRLDRAIAGSAGAFAGLVGIAIGEISNTFLTVRKGIPIKISTGTSALVLHVTILAALLANLAILKAGPSFVHAEEIAIPWRIAAILAPVVVAGGQIGSFLNHRLNERTLLRTLLAAYPTIGLFVLVRALWP
ncbi:MAG: sulfite exporter TauE/SafE family protein [Gemmatimonadetes bacterium]|nr:sulfite exporter TauE/SafE family protein [Gemmatimonadota bacterium]